MEKPTFGKTTFGLTITPLDEETFHISQQKSSKRFSTCNGILYLPQTTDDPTAMIIDLNLEPKYIEEVIQSFHLKQNYPTWNYYVSHTHMDHIANVWKWEELGARIHISELYPADFLCDPNNYLQRYNFIEKVGRENGFKFVRNNGFQSCKHKAHQFKQLLPTSTSEKSLIIPIPLNGHGRGHTGFYLPKNRILHLSCLGFDLREPGAHGFGPWYGLPDCSLGIYWQNIKDMEEFARDIIENPIITSAHGYVIHGYEELPFQYMRQKILDRHHQIREISAQNHLDPKNEEEWISRLLEEDLIYPKKKMHGWLRDLFSYWESGHLRLHLPYLDLPNPDFTTPPKSR